MSESHHYTLNGGECPAPHKPMDDKELMLAIIAWVLDFREPPTEDDK